MFRWLAENHCLPEEVTLHDLRMQAGSSALWSVILYLFISLIMMDWNLADVPDYLTEDIHNPDGDLAENDFVRHFFVIICMVVAVALWLGTAYIAVSASPWAKAAFKERDHRWTEKKMVMRETAMAGIRADGVPEHQVLARLYEKYPGTREDKFRGLLKQFVKQYRDFVAGGRQEQAQEEDGVHRDDDELEASQSLLRVRFENDPDSKDLVRDEDILALYRTPSGEQLTPTYDYEAGLVGEQASGVDPKDWDSWYGQMYILVSMFAEGMPGAPACQDGEFLPRDQWAWNWEVFLQAMIRRGAKFSREQQPTSFFVNVKKEMEKILLLIIRLEETDSEAAAAERMGEVAKAVYDQIGMCFAGVAGVLQEQRLNLEAPSLSKYLVQARYQLLLTIIDRHKDDHQHFNGQRNDAGAQDDDDQFVRRQITQCFIPHWVLQVNELLREVGLSVESADGFSAKTTDALEDIHGKELTDRDIWVLYRDFVDSHDEAVVEYFYQQLATEKDAYVSMLEAHYGRKNPFGQPASQEETDDDIVAAENEQAEGGHRYEVQMAQSFDRVLQIVTGTKLADYQLAETGSDQSWFDDRRSEDEWKGMIRNHVLASAAVEATDGMQTEHAARNIDP